MFGPETMKAMKIALSIVVAGAMAIGAVIGWMISGMGS